MSQANKDLAERWTQQIWNDNNASAVAELVTEDFVFHAFHGLVDEIRGHEGLRKPVGLVRTGFSDGRFTNHETIAEADKVVQRWTFEGTHSGEFFGAPATGKRISFDGITILRVEGGKVAEHWGYFDVVAALQQMGKPIV